MISTQRRVGRFVHLSVPVVFITLRTSRQTQMGVDCAIGLEITHNLNYIPSLS